VLATAAEMEVVWALVLEQEMASNWASMKGAGSELALEEARVQATAEETAEQWAAELEHSWAKELEIVRDSSNTQFLGQPARSRCPLGKSHIQWRLGCLGKCLLGS
jgi:hypothetical protein